MAGLALGHTVRIALRVELDNGERPMCFDTASPLQVTLGEGQLPSGVELMLLGMREGATDRRRLNAEQLWGTRDPDNIVRLPRTDFTRFEPLQIGDELRFDMTAKEHVNGVVRQLEAEHVTVDFNPRWAGASGDVQVTVVAFF